MCARMRVIFPRVCHTPWNCDSCVFFPGYNYSLTLSPIEDFIWNYLLLGAWLNSKSQQCQGKSLWPLKGCFLSNLASGLVEPHGVGPLDTDCSHWLWHCVSVTACGPVWHCVQVWVSAQRLFVCAKIFNVASDTRSLEDPIFLNK